MCHRRCGIERVSFSRFILIFDLFFVAKCGLPILRAFTTYDSLFMARTDSVQAYVLLDSFRFIDNYIREGNTLPSRWFARDFPILVSIFLVIIPEMDPFISFLNILVG